MQTKWEPQTLREQGLWAI